MAQDLISVPSKKAVREAGSRLRKEGLSSSDLEEALSTLSDWRACYFCPIDTFQALIRKKIRNLGIRSAFVAQRLKRTPSITAKLKRFPDMQLDRMQDIGGIRAVVDTVEEVRKLHAALIKGQHKHVPVIPPKDYIENPKSDGYRGIHQVFKYHPTLPQHESLNGMLIEVQIRTRFQHYWATAVETMGVIEKSSFKTGEGTEKFKHFFRLCSALFSIREKQPVIPVLAGKSPVEIATEFKALETELGVFAKLSAFTTAVEASAGVVNKTADGYYLLILNTGEKTTTFIPFTHKQNQLAGKMYMLLEHQERNNPEIDVVLAAAGGMKDLRKAYPNYFVDTKSFIKTLNDICAELLP